MSGLKRVFLGSLSDYLVHHTSIPVVVVKHPDPISIGKHGAYKMSKNLRQPVISLDMLNQNEFKETDVKEPAPQ